jgi:hypothetical protein
MLRHCTSEKTPVLHGHKDWLKPEGFTETVSAIFLSDVATAFLARHGHDEPLANHTQALNACRYHEHPEGMGCTIGKSHPREIVKPKT